MHAQREQILHSWIAAVDRHPNISTSDNLTYTQLLDHLPELCAELAALLKQPNAQEIKREARQHARAHGWKRWRQGYKLEELIREICLIRRDFIDTWLQAFANTNPHFDIDAQNSARRVVESFFDNVIIEATVQFVEEHQEAVRQLNASMKPGAVESPEFVQRVTHLLREPLAPLLLGLEVLLREEALSPRGIEMIEVLQRGVKRSGSDRRNTEINRIVEFNPYPSDAERASGVGRHVRRHLLTSNGNKNERATGIEPA